MDSDERNAKRKRADADKCNHTTSFAGKPNTELSQEEKDAKRQLKKKIKLQSKIKSIENTIRHAIGRKDSKTEKIARKKLEDLLLKENDVVVEMNYVSEFSVNSKISQDSSNVRNSYSAEEMKKKAKPYILNISDALFHCSAAEQALDGGQGNGKGTRTGNANRTTQIQNAVKLLKCMTKGSQTLQMFEDSSALWGYCRQKFYERSMLLCTSIARIEIPICQYSPSFDEDPAMKKQKLIRKKIWNMFLSSKIKNACSIGSGPACDPSGLISFLHMVRSQKTNQLQNLSSSEPVLDKIILMDWSQEWIEVTAPLRNILLEKNLIRLDMKSVFCDVTKDLNDVDNKEANEELFGKTSAPDIDFYSISYLLSETRGKWTSFLDTLVTKSKPQTLFYFAEPTPWQLHDVQKLLNQQLDFVWLDSSMDVSVLWGADRRAGPAVMIALKKE